MDCHVWEYLEFRKEDTNFYWFFFIIINNPFIPVDFGDENVPFQRRKTEDTQ